MILRLGYSKWIFLPTGRSWYICWMLKILMWFSQQAFPDISSSQQEVESHTSMAQSFKCDQGRAQENRSPLNIEQHCLSGVVSWMVLISLIHDTWRSKKVIECRGTAQKALFFHLKVSAQFLQPCPTLLGKSADERLELPWWSSQFSGPVLIHFSFDATCFRCACSFLLLRNYQQLTKVCRLPLMTAFVPSIVVHPSDRLTIL